MARAPDTEGVFGDGPAGITERVGGVRGNNVIAGENSTIISVGGGAKERKKKDIFRNALRYRACGP